MTRRLLAIGHSYCVELNRRLPQEMARAGGWDVTVVAPARFHGDFAWHTTTAAPGEPCRVVPVPIRFGGRVHTMLYGRALRALLREPWDAVHCWEEPYVASAAQIARATARDTPLVFATFQNIFKRYPPPFNWIEDMARRRADGVVAFGRTTREVLDARGWRQPARTIPVGVDVHQFAPDRAAGAATRAALGWRDDDETPVVGFMGRFVPEKGVRLLTQTLAALSTPWRALFIGSGPLDGELRAWAAAHGDRVRIASDVAHDRVPAFLNALTVLCAPSQTTPTWREQFGRMLIEAFACGVPVVASDSGEMPFVVQEAGVIVPEADGGAWTRALESVLGDAARRCELATRGRRAAETVYAWPIVARQHLDFLDELSR
ncbi:MAG TPA: glycosyltransferase family 4 protein [Vicinamibacterales bacterium]|nr:glycosyltransferase family 4 protein [Vicinamibacterales bacterium]